MGGEGEGGGEEGEVKEQEKQMRSECERKRGPLKRLKPKRIFIQLNEANGVSVCVCVSDCVCLHRNLFSKTCKTNMHYSSISTLR